MSNPIEAIVTLSVESNKALHNLAVLRGGEDEMELLNTLVARAIKDAVYRHKRNQQMWQEKKALAERQEELLKLAEERGIDTSAFRQVTR